jgi:membrane protein insertase Oxa1/YidC/SpoIIIJ
MSTWLQLPDVLQSGFTIWGASGFMLKFIHETTGLPYWACFSTLAISVRTVLFPLVLHGAHTASRFGKIAPDVQFQIALFQKDLAVYRAAKASAAQVAFLLRTNMKTLSVTYKLHRVNPLAVFASPLLQLPIFYYVSVDMRKIVNGLDPQLAQNLVEASVAWIPDLTEADPWFGLPVLAGVLLYTNMEVALGRRSMAGPAAGKADTAILLKDLFQSLAVLMPCFTSQMPAGIQIYVATTFCFTMVQSAALRTELVRQYLGLPAMNKDASGATAPGRFTTQMMELKLLEQKARELRGDGPLLGKGVLMHGWEVSFAGRNRPSTIVGSRCRDDATIEQPSSSSLALLPTETPIVPFRIQPSLPSLLPLSQSQPTIPINHLTPTNQPFIHGISAPHWQLPNPQPPITNDRPKEGASHSGATVDEMEAQRDYLPDFSDDVMDRANRGELPRPIQFVSETGKVTSAVTPLSDRRRTGGTGSSPLVVRKKKKAAKKRK